MPGKPCEKLQLWHGTKMDAVQGIIKYGFNRSYSDPQSKSSCFSAQIAGRVKKVPGRKEILGG